MSVLDTLLDARLGEVEEAFRSDLHPRDPGGTGGGQFVRKPGTTIRRGLRPTGADRNPGRLGPATSTRSGQHEAGGTTEKQLPKAVGRGPWTARATLATRALGAGLIKDTEHAHRTRLPDGTLGPYSPERIELHARIARLLFQGAGAHPNDMEAWYMAGGPASGKSSLLKQGLVKPPADAVDINPDIIKTMLPEYQALLAAGDPTAAARAHEESSHIANQVRVLAMKRKHHIVVDGVGNSEPEKFARKIREAQLSGYGTVHVAYATIGTDEAVKRAKVRAERTGREVAEAFVRSSHASVSRRWLEDVSNLEGIRVRIFDNTGRKAKLIAEMRPNGVLVIRVRRLYAAFVGKAGDSDG